MIEIKIFCKECKAENLVILSDLRTGSPPCKGCGAGLFFHRGIAGFVYVLSNPAMTGMVKIGSTTRSVDERVNELSSSTGVPISFVVEAYFESAQPQKDEEKVHIQLKLQRVEGKEFFRTDLETAIKTVRDVVGKEAIQGGKYFGANKEQGNMGLRCTKCGNVWTDSYIRSCPFCLAVTSYVVWDFPYR